MKRAACLLLVCLLVLTACGTKVEALTWQEQYDLGARYLSEGNYQEAILAFNAAIEIDPMQKAGYLGRGKAYILLEETEENLSAALADYEKVIELDEADPEGWLGLADVYIRMGNYEKAREVLLEAMEQTGSHAAVAEKLAEIEQGIFSDSQNRIRRHNTFNIDGTLESYSEYQYDWLGRRSSWTIYEREGLTEGEAGEDLILIRTCQVSFDEQNRPERYDFYNTDGSLYQYDTFTYNEKSLKSEQKRYNSDGSLDVIFRFYYDENDRRIKYESYSEDGTMNNYWVSEYDDEGNLVRETLYTAEGEITGYSTRE